MEITLSLLETSKDAGDDNIKLQIEGAKCEVEIVLKIEPPFPTHGYYTVFTFPTQLSF